MVEPPKSPLDIAMIEYTWVVAISVWGGLVSWFTKLRAGGGFSLIELVGELVISGFAGITCFWILSSSQAPGLLTAAMVGISGHMGTRSVYLLERMISRKLNSYIEAVQCSINKKGKESE